eukprot:Gregarina_sp_Poly_1__2369@NODE_1635_length_3667_cov_217_740556_g1079_i0_p2_GENE_NODE_1635_length_3667_cov_217_740556_g1079_i0NODE_1635_length_3667_cov_217_740556_g1079_i0_p2_ORF_typecomplete_len241_score40_08_NODE_1635_length_3667_cov_217_740556_g1079_i029453589
MSSAFDAAMSLCSLYIPRSNFSNGQYGIKHSRRRNVNGVAGGDILKPAKLKSPANQKGTPMMNKKKRGNDALEEEKRIPPRVELFPETEFETPMIESANAQPAKIRKMDEIAEMAEPSLHSNAENNGNENAMVDQNTQPSGMKLVTTVTYDKQMYEEGEGFVYRQVAKKSQTWVASGAAPGCSAATQKATTKARNTRSTQQLGLESFFKSQRKD